MILESAGLSAREIFKPRARSVVFKSLGLTILLFFAMWVGLEQILSTWIFPFLGSWPWATTIILWLMTTGVVIGAGFLLAPTAAVFAGLFIDEIAEHVEETHYPDDAPGRNIPFTVSIWLATKFSLLVITANLIALMLVLLPGINFAIFFFVNGYLLGREYFQFAAMRYLSERDAAKFRKEHSLTVSLAGLIIAGVVSIPIINLFTPVFAAGMMVHLCKAMGVGNSFSGPQSFGRSSVAA